MAWLTEDTHPWEFIVGCIDGRDSSLLSTPDVYWISAAKRFTWRGWFVQSGIAWTDSDTEVLSKHFQFQTGSSIWWTSLWVRNPSQAIASVEVRNAKYPGYHALTLGTDGTYTDGSGFGEGPFTIRVTGESGATYEAEFDGVEAGALVVADGNLPL